MPRPNPPRSLQSEANLARRIARERERLGMTYEGAAKRMTDAGCPIQPSAIYKIEKAQPPRRISVDELVAFAAVFGVPVHDLLMPPEVVFHKEFKALAAEYEAARNDLGAAWERANAATAALRELAVASNEEWRQLPQGPTERQVREHMTRLWKEHADG